MWEHTFYEAGVYEAGPGIIGAGASSPEEMDQICRQLCELTIATDTLIGQWASMFCRAIKP
jgi:hypothetical protein